MIIFVHIPTLLINSIFSRRCNIWQNTYFTARLFEFPINFLNEVFEFSAIIQYFRYYVCTSRNLQIEVSCQVILISIFRMTNCAVNYN